MARALQASCHNIIHEKQRTEGGSDKISCGKSLLLLSRSLQALEGNTNLINEIANINITDQPANHVIINHSKIATRELQILRRAQAARVTLLGASQRDRARKQQKARREAAQQGREAKIERVSAAAQQQAQLRFHYLS